MFDGLIFGAKKVAEVSGIIDEQPEVEEVASAPQSEPRMKDRVVTLKQVGHVKPVLFDPAVDLKILEELFGVYHDPGKVICYSCPDCGSKHTAPYDGNPIDMLIHTCCTECDYEGEFSNFFDEIEDDNPTTSRTPTDDEITWVSSGKINVGWNTNGFKSVLLTYYGILLGKEPIIDSDSTATDMGYDLEYGQYMTQCGGCTGSCRCSNHRMEYFGKLHSLSDMPTDDLEDI